MTGSHQLLAGASLAVFGLAVGSFLNVVISRVPLKRSIVRPPSACPACAHPVRPRDNIPVVSWLVLHGRCRDCSAPISPRYLLVEALTAVLFGAVGLRFGLSLTSVGEAAFIAGLVALALIDLEHLLLPKRLVYTTLAVTGAALGTEAAATAQWQRLGTAVVCAAVPWAIFYAINWVAPKALGFGDVRLALVIGFALGWLGPGYVLVGFVLASLLGSLVGGALIAAKRMQRKTLVPFGTFLASGAVLALLAGAPVVDWYRGLLGA
jgi:leader peptidase (prepilin peptidase)/N-methyltransferase